MKDRVKLLNKVLSRAGWLPGWELPTDPRKHHPKYIHYILAAQVQGGLTHCQLKQTEVREQRGSESVKEPDARLLCNVEGSRFQFAPFASYEEMHHIDMWRVWHDLDLREWREKGSDLLCLAW
jgi:hypothetical protein